MNRCILANTLKVLETSFGIDECLAVADVIYNSLYKSKDSFTVDELIAVNPENATDIRASFRDMVAETLAIAAGTYQPLTQEEIDFMRETDYEIDRDYTPVEEMYSTADSLLDAGVRFVELCNYKGEFEGYILEELSVKYQTYVGKYNYIYNC